MFDNLTNKLSNIFKEITSRGVLTQDDIKKSIREIRIALLEADVALPAVKAFIAHIEEKALGQEIIKSINPGQMIIKIVQDELTKFISHENAELNLKTKAPAIILMVGLQGAGKTTSTAKLAKFLTTKYNKNVLVASLDIYRPAAQEQLAIIAKQAEVHSLEIIKEANVSEITKRAIHKAETENFDILILDSAGRLHIDDKLIAELQNVKKIANPIETLLVADSMTGQDAVNIAKNFHQSLELTGIILTRIDGDSRGGAALSMSHVTSLPIKFASTGEKIDDFEIFHPERIASRILDKGDIISLVEKASEVAEKEDLEALEKKLSKGSFDLNDMKKQISSIKKFGGLSSIMGMIPGISQFKGKLGEVTQQEDLFKKQEAIINSMTKQERKFPKILNASRKIRIAKGSGTVVSDVNKLLKIHLQMQKTFKKFGKMDKKSFMRGGVSQLKNLIK